MATVEGYKAGVLVPTPTVKTRGLPQTTLNLSTHPPNGSTLWVGQVETADAKGSHGPSLLWFL